MKKVILNRIILLVLMIFFVHCSKDFSNTPQEKKAPDQIVVISELAASASHVMIGGAQVVVQAKLTDQFHNGVFGKPVHFSTTLGTITEVDTTDSEGLAHAVLTSSNQPGTAVVTANYQNEHSRTVTVYFDSTASGSSFSGITTSARIRIARGSLAVKPKKDTTPWMPELHLQCYADHHRR